MPSNDTVPLRVSRQLMVERTCEHCRTSFMTAAYRLKSGRGRFCSRSCRDQHQRDNRPVDIRLWERVNRDGPIPLHRAEYGPCWLWGGALNPTGYGRIYRHFPDAVLTHRLAWELATGETLTSNDVIGHICDVRPCARNDDAGTYTVNGVALPRRGHLFKGTHATNQADMVEKQRHRPYSLPVLRGNDSPSAKLTEDAVREIRRRYAKGGITQTALGLEFGVHNVTISEIILRKKWRHVD